LSGDSSSRLHDLRTLLGLFPAKVELAPTVVQTEDCGSYRRLKVEYSVERDERVRAYLLVPKVINRTASAIYCHHQHAGDYTLGKSEVVGLGGDPNQAIAHELTERGYVTFAPDAIGFEERNWSKSPGAVTYFELATRLVRGETLLAKALHDISVGIDFLESRDEVNPERIGFIGHSYGGRMAIWAPVFDERIKATVSNCGCARFEDSLTRNTGIQMEICVPGILKWGDIEDVVKLVEPTSLLISATEQDKWSRGAQRIYDAAHKVFSRGELDLKMYDVGHQFTSDMREYAYQFLDFHLGKD
jgi:dienelactone hydrolase